MLIVVELFAFVFGTANLLMTYDDLVNNCPTLPTSCNCPELSSLRPCIRISPRANPFRCMTQVH